MPSVIEGIRGWWRSLDEALPPLQPGERLTLWLVTLFTVVTRWLALSRTPWDWDEALFILGLRDYNVALHHPHPPGYPLYIGAAKLFVWAGLSEFHALQAIVFLSSVAIVPAMVFLGRELRLRFSTALISAVLLAFFPNVWLFGGTALSDVPSMTLSILAAALLLRGCRDDRAFFAGAVVLGVAAGVRSQDLGIGFAPAAIASLRGLPRRWLRPLAAALVITLIAGGSYWMAARLSGGWEVYRGAIRAHEHYITTVDSYQNPARPSLWELFPDFFVHPYGAPPINIAVTVLALVSLGVTFARRRGAMLAAIATFGPFCIVAWLMLDHFSTSRFSIGYAPLFALFAADGITSISRTSRRVEAGAAAALTILMIVWTWPALREVHRHDSPTWAATEWLRKHFDPKSSTLFVHDSMSPFASAFLGNIPFVFTGDSVPVPTARTRPGDMFLVEAMPLGGSAMVFERRRGRLVQLVRDRYFEVSVIHLEQMITFAEGWYDPEDDRSGAFRWMGEHGRVLLPPMRGQASLHLHLGVPLDALKVPPVVTVTLNGSVLDRIRATTADLDRTYVVSSRSDASNELVIATDETVNPLALHLSDDARDLGVRARLVDWEHAK